jgi:hypothetical protein
VATAFKKIMVENWPINQHYCLKGVIYMNSKLWIGLIVIVAIIGAAWWYFSSSENISDDVDLIESVGTDNILLDDDNDEKPAAVAGETTSLAAVGSYSGSGTATRSFDGSKFSHTVVATIDDPATGKFYEGWLVMPSATGPKFFSTGKLELKDGSYRLTFIANQNYPDHTNVVITEETLANGLDNIPEAHVLEGSF